MRVMSRQARVGDVRMAVDDALAAQDKQDGYILACQATVRGAARVDA
jgi:ferredoxin